MKKHAGVKCVVVSGIPEDGPMQAVSRTSGSNTIAVSDLITFIVEQVRGL